MSAVRSLPLLISGPLALGALAPASAAFPLINAQDEAASATEASEVLWIHGERVLLRPGVELENAAVLVQDGLILALGADVAAPEGARAIEGAVVCAGFLDAWSALGIDPRSASDMGTLPSTRSVDALDPYRRPDLRAEALGAGVTSARVQAGGPAPVGGLGAVVSTSPESQAQVLLEDACVSATVGIARGGSRLDPFDRLAEVGRLAGWLKKGESYGQDQIEYRHELEEWQTAIAEKREELEEDFKKAKKKRDKEIEKAEEKRKEFKEDKYKEDKKPKKPRYDPNDEVLARVVSGELPLVVEAHGAAEIRSLLEDTAPFDRLRLVLAGATDAAHFAAELAERGIPVLLQVNPARLGHGDYDAYELSLAGQLARAGVEVLLGTGGENHARDLRQLACLAVGYGLDAEAALHAITLGPARAFDVSDRVGSLERGMRADLVVLDGDPLDSRSRVQLVVSRGRVVGP